MCAVARAHHFLFDADPVFADELGAVLTSDRWRRILGDPILRRLVIEGVMRPMRPSVGNLVGRARYLEERVQDAVDRGISQYVIVGAGMDSFSSRRKDLVDRLRVIELDHPSTQQVKRDRLATYQLLPDGVEYVAVDFETEDIESALTRSSFDPDKATLFSWMGVSYYLPEPTVYAVLESMRISAPGGCEIVFDYKTPRDDDRRQDRLPRRLVTALTGSVGEPQITSFNDVELRTKLAETGLDRVQLVTGDQMAELYFTGRSDGLRPFRMAAVRRSIRAPSPVPARTMASASARISAKVSPISAAS